MPKVTGMECYFCAVSIYNAEHIALDDDDEIVYLCSDCYKLAAKFFVKGRKTT